MNKHTTGPWKIDCLSYGQEGNWNPHHRRNIRIFAPDITSTGFILVNSIGPENNNIEQEANARLIAAAPELLEALQTLVDDCIHASGSMDYNYGEFDLKAAEAAILKAKGDQQ